MSRVYAAEPVPTLIGAAADHRFVAGPPELLAAVHALAAGVLGGPPRPMRRTGWRRPLPTCAAPGRGPGARRRPTCRPRRRPWCIRSTSALGARGTTFDLIDPIAVRPGDRAASMAALLDEMARAGWTRC